VDQRQTSGLLNEEKNAFLSGALPIIRFQLDEKRQERDGVLFKKKLSRFRPGYVEQVADHLAKLESVFQNNVQILALLGSDLSDETIQH